MTTSIDNLVDDCLLHIFEYLNPLSRMSAGRVCKRWEELARRTVIKVTAIELNNIEVCFDVPAIKINEGSVNPKIMKSVLQFIGPEVKSIHLGICKKGSIVFNDDHGYKISDDYNAEEFVSMLSQSCTNIEELKINTKSIDFKFIIEQFVKSNKKLKKVFLPENPLPMLSSGFDSVEEVIWNVNPDSNVQHFGPLFPNVKRLTLLVSASQDQFESIVSSILKQIKHLNSLNLLIKSNFKSNHTLRILSDIRAFSQLEELRIWSDAILDVEVDFGADSITKLIESCQSLRVVKFHKFGLGTTDVSSFLTLPKLEQLEITNARFFTSESLNKMNVNQFENLTTLRIDFNYDVSYNLSGIFHALGKMPALKYFIVNAMLDEQRIVKFACKVIEKLIHFKDINLSLGSEDSFRVYKNRNLPYDLEPLSLYIKSNDLRPYIQEIREFLSGLEGCSFTYSDEGIIDEYYWRNQYYGDWFREYEGLYTICECYMYCDFHTSEYE